jgi:pyruvyltransferase
VYGTGFLNSTDRIIHEPQKICAVRGPLTAERVTECIGDCPKMYGDPAVLFKEFYQPKIDQKYSLGIIPYWSDYRKISHHYADVPGVQVINIEAGATRFIEEICSCQYIASSSLHGLIMADAYNIPNVWIKMLSGMHPDDFKFYDYYGSVQCEREPVHPESVSIPDLCSVADTVTHPIDTKQLLAVCPFYDSSNHTQERKRNTLTNISE